MCIYVSIAKSKIFTQDLLNVIGRLHRCQFSFQQKCICSRVCVWCFTVERKIFPNKNESKQSDLQIHFCPCFHILLCALRNENKRHNSLLRADGVRDIEAMMGRRQGDVAKNEKETTNPTFVPPWTNIQIYIFKYEQKIFVWQNEKWQKQTNTIAKWKCSVHNGFRSVTVWWFKPRFGTTTIVHPAPVNVTSNSVSVPQLKEIKLTIYICASKSAYLMSLSKFRVSSC